MLISSMIFIYNIEETSIYFLDEDLCTIQVENSLKKSLLDNHPFQ